MSFNETKLFFCLSRLLRLLVVCFFLFILTPKANSQNIYIGEILYSNSISSFPELDDSSLQIATKYLFSLNSRDMKTVLSNPKDTGFYSSISSMLFILPNRDWFQIILHDLTKDKKHYLLTCIIQYQVPESNIISYVGKVLIPFELDAYKNIKFLNYFDYYSKYQDFTVRKHNIVTTSDNSKNLNKIANYIEDVKRKYNLDLAIDKVLYYTYYKGNVNPYKVFGITDFVLAHQGTILSIDSSFVILDKSGGGFYKHELVHYTTANYNLGKFFNEGFASFLAGSTAKCNNICDYEKLRIAFSEITNDSIFDYILKWKVIAGKPYGIYYYQLASFTCYLMQKKFGSTLFSIPNTEPVLKTNSSSVIISFLKREFVLENSNTTLYSFYADEIKHYLALNKDKL